MRVLLTLLAGVLVAASAPAPAPAETELDRTVALFNATKAAFAEIIWEPRRDLPRDRLVSTLFNCLGPSDYSDGADLFGAQEWPGLSQLSLDFAYAETLLYLHGYPPDRWADATARFQMEMIRLALDEPAIFRADYHDRSRNFMDSFLSWLNATSGPELTPLTYEGECGAGEATIHFSTSPPGGQISLIPRWNYLVCRARDIDPEDRIACEGWRSMADLTVRAVVGHYHYAVVWEDEGVLHFGRLDFDNRSLDNERVTLTRLGPRYH